mmetsp:Transcript_4078/g.15348  ORF Transcript_4078/g.15348 Transcript_4078/m.15348 type:complete len:118 (-) Transcript_4078:564-917(-)
MMTEQDKVILNLITNEVEIVMREDYLDEGERGEKVMVEKGCVTLGQSQIFFLLTHSAHNLRKESAAQRQPAATCTQCPAAAPTFSQPHPQLPSNHLSSLHTNNPSTSKKSKTSLDPH